MTRHRFFFGISMLARVATGILSLFVLARGLGPTDYGFVVTVFAYSSIAALLTDFGFTVQALRDIGVEPHRAGELISACLRVKTLLVLVFSPVIFLVALSFGISAEFLVASVLLYSSIIAMSYGELALVALRGIGLYDKEAYSVVVGSVVFFVIIGFAALVSPSLISISVSILVARVIQSIFSLYTVSKHVSFSKSADGAIAGTFNSLRNNYKSAIFNSLLLISAQIDAILISSSLGLHAIALYQIGSRLASYFDIPSQVASNVYLPEIARKLESNSLGTANFVRKVQVEFVLYGLLFSAAFFLVAPIASHVIAGPDFAISQFMWLGFAAMVFLRYVAVLPGLLLIASKKMRSAIISQSFSIATVVLSFVLVLPHLGEAWSPWLIVVSLVVNCAFNFGYAWKTYRDGDSDIERVIP